MKRLLLMLAIVMLVVSSVINLSATTTTATVTSTDGFVFANGTVDAVFTPPGGIINQHLYLLNGAAFPYEVKGTMNGSGVFSLTLTDDTLVRPLGGLWSFTVCPPVSFPCTTVQANVFGASIDLSTIISNALPAITGQGFTPPTFFADSEIPNPTTGQIYNNLSTGLRVFNGSTWGAIATGGTSPAWSTITSFPAGCVNQVLNGVGTGGALPCITITSAYVDSSIELTSHKNQANGYVGLNGSSNATIAGTLTVAGNVTVGGILFNNGFLNLNSGIPGVNPSVSGSGNSNIQVLVDGYFAQSVNTGNSIEFLPRFFSSVLSFGSGTATLSPAFANTPQFCWCNDPAQGGTIQGCSAAPTSTTNVNIKSTSGASSDTVYGACYGNPN